MLKEAVDIGRGGCSGETAADVCGLALMTVVGGFAGDGRSLSDERMHCQTLVP